jgi:hypothetical protein
MIKRSKYIEEDVLSLNSEEDHPWSTSLWLIDFRVIMSYPDRLMRCIVLIFVDETSPTET